MNPAALAFLMIVAFASCVYTGYAHPAEQLMRDDVKSGETGISGFTESRHKWQVVDNCTRDLIETGENPFLTCFQEVNSIYPDSVTYSAKAVIRFCNNSCPTVLRTLFEAIEKDCSSSAAPDKYQLDLIDGACHMDPDGFYCAEVYNDGFNKTMQQHYKDCVTEFDGGKDCTDNCRLVVNYIISDLGCCYVDLANFLEYDEGDKVIASKVFAACGMTEPDSCED